MSRDRDDHIIPECAEKSKADFIITGDQDLLVLNEDLKTKMVSTYLKYLKKGSRESAPLPL